MAMKTDERTEVEGIERRKRSGVLEKEPGDSAVFETKGGNQADHQLPEYALGLAALPPPQPSRAAPLLRSPSPFLRPLHPGIRTPFRADLRSSAWDRPQDRRAFFRLRPSRRRLRARPVRRLRE